MKFSQFERHEGTKKRKKVEFPEVYMVAMVSNLR